MSEKSIEDYMKDDMYVCGSGEYSVLTDKKSRIKRVKKHFTITTDYHHKKFDDFIKYNYIPYGLKLDLDNEGQFWFMNKNNVIRSDETLERAHRLNKNYENTQKILNKLKKS